LETEYDLYVKELQSELMELREQLQECLSENDYEYANFYQKAVWRVENKLRIFNSLNSDTYKQDEQKLDDAIIELRDGILRRFKFILLPACDFYLNFYKLDSGKLYCELPTEAELLQAYHYVYFPAKVSSILALGFAYNPENDNTLGLEFNVSSNNSCLEIKAIIARLMLDVLHIPPGSNGYISKHPAQ
jgi:hypothetical protein